MHPFQGRVTMVMAHTFLRGCILRTTTQLIKRQKFCKWRDLCITRKNRNRISAWVKTFLNGEVIRLQVTHSDTEYAGLSNLWKVGNLLSCVGSDKSLNRDTEPLRKASFPLYSKGVQGLKNL